MLRFIYGAQRVRRTRVRAQAARSARVCRDAKYGRQTHTRSFSIPACFRHPRARNSLKRRMRGSCSRYFLFLRPCNANAFHRAPAALTPIWMPISDTGAIGDSRRYSWERTMHLARISHAYGERARVVRFRVLHA